ncbi:MAG: HAD family hydrolase [Deltaproteobacteria bacterium]|nr:HAD family hydrolase [Deltaproteobacteria bacterium]MBW2393248.1 HAD family hydrolase [Deltaproteobacteria bacterium]
MKLLALDFDGVISDSAREAFVVALRSFRELRPACGLPEIARASEAPDLYAAFVDRMPLGNRAEDFAVVLATLDAGVPLPDQAAYDAFHASLDADELAAFHTRFYEVRSAWAAKDPEGWLAEMSPYPEVLPVLKRHANDVILAIATAKDRASVERLLVRYGIASLFPPERVLDKEAGRSKRAHLEALAGRTGVAFSDITFVDDKLNHLASVASLGVRCALASWGYNGEREVRAARSQGHQVLRLESLESDLFS